MKILLEKINKLSPFFLGIWALILSLLYSILSIVRHNNFQSGAFDLGIFDQAIWQYSRFLYPYNTIKERFILGDHLTLSLPLFAPLFYIWGDVRILLITQAIWITCSIIPIYKIARIRNFTPLVSLCVSFAYSIFYGIQFGVYFDWHPIIFGVGLLAWLAYFFEAKKKKLFWITLIAMLLTQENMGIALACLGIIYFFQKQHRKKAIYFFIGGITATVISVLIISHLSPVGYQYKPKIAHDPISIVEQFYDTQDKKLVWLYSFSGFAFLPLLSPGGILAVIFDLSQYFAAASEFGHMLTPYLHHRAILGVFLALGVLDSLQFLEKRKINLLYIAAPMVLIALFFQYYFHLPLNKLVKKEYWNRESWMDDTDKLLKIVPKNVSIASTQHITPHLSQRKEIYLIWPRKKSGLDAQKLCKKESCWWLDIAGKPKYLIINLDNRQWVTQLLESPENFKSAVVNMEKTGKISLEKNINTAYIYKINY
ncbi:MAG TPA: DUF2079 domain-containing protein [Candidatus Limnocylindrales bacterium]|nr:DUF2079 domain-containing protein [Candidatus Limnocylindrales bacterium]